MDAQIGQDYIVGAAFADSAGPITGLVDVAVTVINRADGSTLTSGTAIETPPPPGGVTTETPPMAGVYEFTINSTFLTTRMRLTATFVSPSRELRAETSFSVGDVPPTARTRRELRQRIASRLFPDSAVWQERVASSAANTTTSASLPTLLVGGANEFRGYWLAFGSGLNRGLERWASGWDEQAMVLTWAPALPGAVAVGDLVDLLPIRPSRVNGAIDDALADLAGYAMIEADQADFPTDGATTEWALPNDARYVYRVGLINDDDDAFLGWLQPGDWDILPGRKLHVWGDRVAGWGPLAWHAYASHPGMMGGHRLRVLMLVDPDPPLYDESSVDAPPETIVAQAAYRLSLTLTQQRDLLPFLQREAELARNKARTALPPGVREVSR